VSAVVLPLEVQIKDHKAQLQSRLDNLAKINEKTTSINEQMAILKAAEADLKKQREMIESLITRVSQYEKVTQTPAPAAVARPARPPSPADAMATTRMATFEPEKTITEPQPQAPAKPAAPLIGDDAFASMLKKPPSAAPAFDPLKTQKMDADPTRTQRMDAPEAQRTQRLDDPQRTARLDAQPAAAQPAKPVSKPATRADGGDKTVQIPKLDPAFKPEATQILDASHTTTQKLDPQATATQKLDPNASTSNAEQTQRLDDSIWKLQEAKRILQNINQK
jgi:hypothetical protein